MYSTQKSFNQLISGIKPRSSVQSGQPHSLQNFLLGILINTVSQAYTRQNTPLRPVEDKNRQEVFETHEYVFVRVPIPKKVDKSRISIYVGTSRVTLRWTPGGTDHIYHLPVDVLTKDSEASVKDNVIEIKMPKEPNPDIRRIYVDPHKKA